jgi:type VI secretion system protein ImpG
MPDELLPFYNRELSYLRDLGAEFAETHPKIAGRLRLGADEVEDPHVSRLIQSVAFLNARIRRKLEDNFPELTDALLGILYPHYLAPIPSMAIVQFVCDPELSSSYTVAKGSSLETDRVHGEPCYFRTVYPVETWPIEIEAASLVGAPFQAPRVGRAQSASAVLHLELRTRDETVTFSELAPESLRFYVRGDSTQTYELYELMMNDVVDIAIADSPDDANARSIPVDSIRSVGFGPDEGMLPYSQRSVLAYRLLTDFFAFPRKYLFFDVCNLPRDKELGNRVHLFFYVRRSTDDLEQSVDVDSLALGCTPVINLFEQRTEPVRVDQTVTRYHVVPDARRPLGTEIYSLDHVELSRANGDTKEVRPFFGIPPLGHREQADVHWISSRTETLRPDGAAGAGSEVTLALVDTDFQATQPADGVLTIEATCFNRDLPARLPFGGDQPRLGFSEGGGPIERIRCLTPPTKTTRPSRGDGLTWRLISHLSLNHLSIAQGPEATRAFQEILRLYDFSGAPENANAVEGLLKVEGVPKVMRVLSQGLPGVCRGVELSLHFDESRYTGIGMFLFASVLERFAAMYCSMNTFVQTRITSEQREGEIRRWVPRAGETDIL